MVKNTETNPIWEFFNPDNKDQSDIALRHALANMTAVVFSLPSRSTHLWYHMFAPGDLRNSYLTGFMVCSITLIFMPIMFLLCLSVSQSS